MVSDMAPIIKLDQSSYAFANIYEIATKLLGIIHVRPLLHIYFTIMYNINWIWSSINRLKPLAKDSETYFSKTPFLQQKYGVWVE